ncbi:nitroreductase [Nocardia transvalensis]|uniref:Nitroreductase n=1 Tax=Nocardia transvalensis TaxID=37333 RepID=A0A7W9PIV4_9NOCA|nr:hypothetical protein [Nocardia transvalensis]MBB5916705.1 nitroreductase [Nocardia transvalensis]
MTIGKHSTVSAPDRQTLLTAVRLAQRAPSVHNTQPWHWRFDGTRLRLYADPDRLLPATDPHGRQQIISCGAVLHHARTAFAAYGWRTDTIRQPEPDRPAYLAVIDFRPWPDPPAGIAARARAIGQRYSDRLPMREPRGWNRLLPELRKLASPHEISLDVLTGDARARLAALSVRAATARSDDPMYQIELNWWAGHPDTPEGVPPTALVSDAEAARVDVGRAFPSAPHSERRPSTDDHSEYVVLSSYGDSVPRWLHTGEALSAVLLEATVAGLHTCALTHITELPAGRRAVANLVPLPATPQALLRIGTTPADEPAPPTTPRRPLTDVVTIEHG